MKKFFSLVLALAMALSMASFASAEETTTIHIGVIGPMTGAAAVYGLAVARGAEIAVEEINAAGKVNIVLDVQDDENDAEKSINAYNATLAGQGHAGHPWLRDDNPLHCCLRAGV